MHKDLHAIAIGASSGGVAALLEIAAALPRDFPAFLFVVQHIGAGPSVLPELMRARGPNHAMHPSDGDQPLPGTIYVAPPDHHMLVQRGTIRLIRGPKENHARPAIDPLFRSVAITFGERAVGVVLTGQLDDGTAGLAAIKGCGGVAIVQDPATASEPSMPRSALANVAVDYCLHLGEIVPRLAGIVGTAPPGSLGVPERLRHEQLVMQGGHPMDNLRAIAEPSGLTFPDCGGGLRELKDRRPLRYRCHTGHAFSVQSLHHSQETSSEHSLWSSVRALRESEVLLRRVASVARGNGDRAQGDAGERQADRVRDDADRLLRTIEDRDGGA